MQQDTDGEVRSFGARIKGWASVCKYINCCPPCSHHVHYTNDITKDTIAGWIAECEIKLNIDWSQHFKWNMSLNDIIQYAEAEESGNHFWSVCRMKADDLNKPKEKSSAVKTHLTVSECPIWEELYSPRNYRCTGKREMDLDYHIYIDMANKWIKRPSKAPTIYFLDNINQW